MQKVIRLISIFSDEIKKSLEGLRSKSTLISGRKISESESEIDVDLDFLIDLDNIDENFVLLMLDSLEHYKIYKLCIIVCNRYGLS